MYSGILDSNHPDGREDKGTIIQVQVRPLGDILKEHLPANQSIDFMTVDCEGHELAVLKSNDWERFRPSVLLVEEHRTRRSEGLRNLLSSLDYQLHARMGLTLFFLAREFSYLP
jgi:hypothetical protein